MAKQDKPKNKNVATGPSAELTHSPFAALRGATGAAPSETGPQAAPPSAAEASARQGRLILRRETKHRGGKPVVIVTGLEALTEDEAETLARELKRALACGGTLEQHGSERQLVLQGDQPARVAELLRGRGFRVGGATS